MCMLIYILNGGIVPHVIMAPFILIKQISDDMNVWFTIRSVSRVGFAKTFLNYFQRIVDHLSFLFEWPKVESYYKRSHKPQLSLNYPSIY